MKVEGKFLPNITATNTTEKQDLIYKITEKKVVIEHELKSK